MSKERPFWDYSDAPPRRQLTAEEESRGLEAAAFRVFGPRKLRAQQEQIAKQQEKINGLETTLKKHLKRLSPPSKSRASGLRRIIHRVKVEKPSLSPLQIAIRVDRVLEASKTEFAAVCPKSWTNKKKQLPRSLQDALRDPALKKLVAPMISKA